MSRLAASRWLHEKVQTPVHVVWQIFKRGAKTCLRLRDTRPLLLASFTRFIWCFQSILAVMAYKADAKNIYYQRQYAKEAVGLALHWILKGAFLFGYMPGILTGLAFFLISECLGGFGIAIVVFLNHYPLEKVEESVWDGHGFCAGQIHTTMNIQRGVIVDWFFGGVLVLEALRLAQAGAGVLPECHGVLGVFPAYLLNGACV